MVHDLLFHTLLLLGILGLSASLIWRWRRRHAATSHAITQATRRSPANPPFPGLIHKPSCVTCEDGAQEQAKASPAAPSPMVLTHWLMVAWSTDTPRSCISSSTWRYLNGYARYYRTQVRMMSLTKWAPLKLIMIFPSGLAMHERGDHTSDRLQRKFATELSCSPGAPRGMKIEFTR